MLYREIFNLIRGKCVSDEAAKAAANDVVKFIETKLSALADRVHDSNYGDDNITLREIEEKLRGILS